MAFQTDHAPVQVPHIEPVDIEVRWDHPYKNRGKNKSGCGHALADGSTCMAAQAAPEHLGLPLSLNMVGSRGGHFTYKTFKEAWEEVLIERLRSTPLPAGWETEIWTPEPGTPKIETIYVEALLTFPMQRAGRDQGNFRWFVEKCLGDALVKGGWLEDDSYWPVRHYECGGLQMQYEKGVGSTRLMLMPGF